MPNILIPLSHKNEASKVIFEFLKAQAPHGQFGKTFAMPPEHEGPNGISLIGVPPGAVAHLEKLGIPFEVQ